MVHKSTLEDNKTQPMPAHVGTMGWSYADWAGVFYSEGTASRDYITHYAQTFDTVEIDSTFYGTPREAQVKQWAQITPSGFTFCPKVPRSITHDMRLVGVQEPLSEFVRVMNLLGAKCGPILLQMPPDFTRQELPNLRAFIPTLAQFGDAQTRFAIEFRHRSLLAPEVSQLLRDHNVALALTDYVSMPRRFELTTDFLYLRLIGQHGTYPQHDKLYGDHTHEMQVWAQAILAHQPSLTTAYIQCNNDYEGYSPETALRFQQMLGLPVRPVPASVQGSLF